MPPRVLLLGSGGQVGTALRKYLKDATAPSHESANLLRPADIATLINEMRPQVIVNAAAYTAVDKAESEPDLAFCINRDAPRLLAEAASRIGALLVHYSTDYVFAGSRNADARGYRESDAPGPLSVYGESKLAGEIAIAQTGCRHVILRTAWVYAGMGGNFVRTIRRLSLERLLLRVVADQIGSPTWADDIAAVTAAILSNLSGDIDDIPEQKYGVFHLTSGGRTSWHNFAETIVNAERERNPAVVTRAIEAITTAEYPTPAKRPSFSVLDNSLLRDIYGFVIDDWQTRFQAFLSRETPEK